MLNFAAFGQQVHEEGHKYHIGIGASATKLSDETGLKPGVHLHLLRTISASGRWGVGVGYEGVKVESWHNGFNLLLNYRPVEFLSFNLGPGIVSEKTGDGREFKPAIHAESVIEFDVWKIHLGPMAGIGLDKEHKHISFGIHMGFGIE